MEPAREIQIRLDSPRYSGWNFIAGSAKQVLRCDAMRGPTTLSDSCGIQRVWDDPLEALDWMWVQVRECPRTARWIGYLSYDLGRLFEALARKPEDDLSLPLFVFSLHERGSESTSDCTTDFCARDVRSNVSRTGYEAAVGRAIEYIGAGDIFQVNLSQRFTADCDAPAASIYQHLREGYPADYGACLSYGDFALLSNSPELFLGVTVDRIVKTRPIKGTRPRQPGMDAELGESIKDQAELNMIVDLERNDLGRVCETGSVGVTEPRRIEAHPTVYHGVATIEGKLRHGVSFVDLLRATFPGGSVTGAPKIRAMQIIDELEPNARGPYCGAIGYLASDGSMQFNLAIRTMILKEGLVHIPVGGGIVADSKPGEEYQETLVKAKAMFAALGLK